MNESRASRRLGMVLGLPGIALGLVLLVGFSLRVVVTKLAFASTFDTATPGLMALHILKGARPLFFYGQSYMGALEAYVAALMFKLFGFSELSLALSPILFSVAWIAATYLLFRDLVDRRVGLAAALIVAVPGWYTLWYSIGSYGGYPATFFFGTTALWLCLRLAIKKLSTRQEWIHILSLGLVAGLGIWTNYQSASYLVLGALLLIPFLVRVRFSPKVLGKFVVGGSLFLIGCWPAVVAHLSEEGGDRLVKWDFSPEYIRHTFHNMWHGELRYLLFPRVGIAMAIKASVVVLLLVAACSYLAHLWFAKDRRCRIQALLPLVFCVLFLAMFLPHSMASIRAPRYVIPLYLMMLCGLLAVPVASRNALQRRVAWALLALWIGYNAAGNAYRVRAKAPKTAEVIEERQRLVASARRIGAKHVIMVGGFVFGHEGQILSLYAEDEIRFTSSFNERYQPAAQAAESDDDLVLACEKSKLDKTVQALEDLKVEHKAIKDWVSLVYDIDVPHADRKAVPPSDMSMTFKGAVTGEGSNLIDRMPETLVRGEVDGDNSLTIDLGKERHVGGFWLMNQHVYGEGLPERYGVSVSKDGENYELVRPKNGRRTSVAYICGNMVYMKGYHGWFESRFKPVSCRYVRVHMVSGLGTGSSWQLNEVFVFEHVGDAEKIDDSEVDDIAAAIRERDVTFTMCDRWLSARLIDRLSMRNGDYPAFPRLNTKCRYTLLSRRLRPKKGLAVAVDRSLREECEALLEEACGGARPWEVVEFPHYVLLIFRDEAKRAEDTAFDLVWTDATLLKTFEEK